MDLYRIDSSLRKSFSERTSHFQRADVTSTVPHHNDLSKFPSNDILSSSAWSAVIHQPDQDSDPEDLPSTVDIDAIKEPPTPINASAQTPAGQLHGDSHSFELSDEQNAGDSGSDSDSDSESGNSENENAASGGDSGSCSDSDSASSHPSSSSSKGKAPSSRSSRSNSPPSVDEDQRRQQFSVRETNFDEGGLKLKLSALRKPKQKYDDDSSDSSESKYPSDKKKSKFDNRLKSKKLYSLKSRNDGKSKFAPFSRDRIKYDNPNDKDSDSDSSSSSNTSPEKSQSPWSAKARMPLKSNSKLEASIFRSIMPNAEYRNHTGVKDDKVERSTNHLGNKRNETNRNSLMSTKESVLGAHLRYRNMNRSSFISSSLKLPQACKLSEDSDESLESSRTGSRNNHKKENNRDTIEKLAQQLTQPGTTSDQLQVLNEEDLAAVLPDVAGATSGGGEFELTDGSGGKKKPRAIIESKKTASSDSSSDAELFPKQKQIVRDVINSIHVDSDASNDSDDSSHKQKSSNEESSSNDEDDKGKRNEKGQYSSNLLEAFAEQTDRLNKSTATTKSKTDKTSGNLSANKKGRNDVTRKRGRPPKVKRSAKAKVEAYMRLDCVVSNVSPDSGIQSNSASPLYHSLHSPGIFNQNSRAAVTSSKLATTTVPAKPLSLSQKAVLSASQKNSHKREIENNIKTVKNHREVPRIPITESSNNKKECVEKKVALALKKPAPIKLANDTVKMSKQSSKISPTSTHADLALFQGKRGPGRPKKIAPTKVNGKTKAEKSLPLELEGPFEKTQDRKPAAAEPVFKTKPKKMKYRSPVAMCLEGRKKRRKKKPIQAPVLVQPSKIPSVPPSLPRYPAHKEWLHKHKKRKKKENKEKIINLEFLKIIDELAEVFEKKCLIEDKKSSKTSHRIKEKSKKKKHAEKIKHSENESECDIASPLSITASITSSKRRHKKIAIEIPKISEATCDQRLPLKKRHYHVSASSITSNSHQSHESKNSRSEKHSSSHSGETICSSSTTPFETTAKPASKVGNAPKTNVDVSKSKIDSQKYSIKADAQKHASKSDAMKSASKSESNKISGKTESHKTSKSEPCKALKNDSQKNTQKSDTRKSASLKADNQKTLKNDSSKSCKTESKQDKETVDNIAVTPKKRLRVDEGKKANQKHAANKTDSESLLPLRRSGRSVQSSNQKLNKTDSVGQDTKSAPEQKSSGGLKKKIDTEVESSVEKSTASKRNLRPQSNTGKRTESASSKNSSKNDAAETSKSTSNSTISKTDMSKKDKSDTRGKENTPGAPSSNDMTIEKEPVDDGTGANDNANALTTPTKQPINKPQLITPLPSEPVPVNPSSPNLKPPAGVFEPSRKLPSSLSKCKKTSIADVLSKLTEKLKDLDSPLKNTSALIEKIGVSKNDAEGPNSDRILRSKRTSSDGDNADAKKAKICKDMSIRLRKLSSSELSNSATPGTDSKPKLKRRKTNKTGFPVKKKRKRMKTNSETSQMYDTTEETSIESTTEDEKTDATEEPAECPVGKVKHELIEEQAGKNENIENNPPNLQLVDSAGVKVKCEVMSEDETTPHEARNLIKNRKKIAKSDVPNRLLPSRCSARIYIKQQIRAREMKKSKKKSANKVKTKKNRKRTNSVGGAKDEHPVIGKTLRPRECKNKDVPKHDTDKDTRSKNANDKDHRSKEETDREEFSSDTESVKYQNTKKLEIPKWKRKYISAGLFSDFYKEEKHSSVDSKNRFNYKEEDHPHGLLPPPPYFEDWVRGRRVDFKLPFDLWWLHSHNQLPGRDDVVHSWNYKKIRTNVYYDVKPTYMYEAQACNCKMPTEKEKLGCGEDCINRMVYAECSPQLCPLKQKCSNQKIQKHEWASKLVKFMTRDKGWGVKTKEPIRNGDFILEYVGEVVSDKEFKKRMSSLYTHDIHHYCLNLDGGLVIDGHRMGGAGRFVNHSCEPNCEMQKWSVNGLFRMALFALRDIEAGEELTYDYNFALFNPAEGQPCLCGSSKCRGVIGGKSQRVAVSTASTSVSVNDASSSATVSSNNGDKKSNRIRPRKQIRKNVSVVNADNIQSQRRDSVASSNSVGVLPQRNMYNLTPVRPLTAVEKKIVRNFRVFLIRNLTKIQIFREKLFQIYNNKENSNGVNQNSSKIEDAAAKESAVFLTQLNALSTQRFIRTRRLAQAQDNPEMTKTAQLANVFRTIYNDVVSAKDEKGEPFSSLFMTLPSKRKLPMYYQRIGDPIDLTTIEKNIVTGVYKNVELFDKDMNKLIMNSVKYYGRTSDYGIAAVRLRKEYNIAKLNYVPQIKEIIGDAIPPSFMPVQEDPGDEEEDVIRCICGLYNDEGLMIQCERCLVWQHCDCVKADPNAEHYLCERCNPRDVDYEITLDIVPDYANPGEKHYLTLMRDDLQIRQGDTVYVLRDIPNPETGTRHSFRTIKNFKYEDCDIFRVERLWKNEKGERMSFGHHYLRPHETFHEPSRRFFPNEVVKVPLYETVPLDLIMGQCYVLDLHTYRKGRPIDSDPQHIYICEFRVDKAARVFFKMTKSKQYAVCTKNYAFDKYDTPLKPARTYAPHGEVKPLPVTSSAIASKQQVNCQKVRPAKSEESAVAASDTHRTFFENTMENSSNCVKMDEDDLPLSHFRDSKAEKQKQRLNSILLKLLAKKSSTKAPLDASYLLELGKRNRKKPDLFTT